MRMIALALLGTVLAAGCQPTVKDGMPVAERRLAEKIVDSGLLVPVGEGSQRQMAGQLAQQAMMGGALAPEQFVQAAMAIERALEPVAKEARETAIKGLVDAYNVKELELLADFFVSKQGEQVRNKITEALEPSQALMNERAQTVTAEALQRLKAAWPAPTPTPAAPQGDPRSN